MADVEVSYKGSTIGSLSASGSLTLETEGKYCEDDIGITYTSPGGGGITLPWASSITEVTIGANSVTNTAGVQTYFSGYTYKFILFAGTFTVNNQFAAGYSLNQDGVMGQAYRNRNGGIASANVATNYDAFLVEGTKYYLIAQ